MDKLLELEEPGWQAMSSPSPTDFLERWLANNALMVVPGMIIDRDAFLEAVTSEPPWKTHHIAEPRIVAFTDDCSAVLYRVTAQRDGQPPYVALVTSVYVRKGGDRKLIYHQQAPTG